jgi:Aspartyl/asparaginyl-tRNA synthetases
MAEDAGYWKRSKRVEEISDKDENRELVLSGWTSNLRNLKSISFIRLRDGEKDIQITCKSDETRALSKKITPESVIAVRGLLNKNESVDGNYEIIAEKIKILNLAKAPLLLDVSGKVKADFDTRFDSRFMDLRNPRNIAIFRIKSKAITIIRDECLSQGFVEVHTPKIIATATEGGTQLFSVQYFEKDVIWANRHSCTRRF